MLSEKGAPTPVAWTKLPAPQSLMAQLDSAAADQIVKGSPLLPKYGEQIDRESAYEKLLAKVAPPAEAAPSKPASGPAPAQQRAPRPQQEKSVVSEVLGSSAVKGFLRSAATAAGREIMRSVFGTAKRRR